MKSLKLIRDDGYENVRYAALGDQEFKTLVIADRKKDQKQWYEEPGIETVPEKVSDIIRSYTLPAIDLGNKEDDYLREQATSKVVTVVVENILDSQPFVETRNNRQVRDGVAFCDILVAKIQNGVLQGTTVYIKQTQAGFRQPRDIHKMVGRAFPVKLTEIHVLTVSNYRLKTQNPENYVVEGSIEIAEWLTNYELQQRIEAGQEAAERAGESTPRILNTVQEGVVSSIINQGNNAGLMLMTKNFQTVFIPANLVSYEYDSPFVRLDQIVSLYDKVAFKLVGADIQTPAPNQRERHIVHDYIRIVGDMKVLEESPEDRLKAAVDEGRLDGRLFKARFDSFDPVRGHLVELVDFPGIRIKMDHSAALDGVSFKRGEELSVIIKRSRYRYADANSKSKRATEGNEQTSNKKKVLFTIHSKFNTFYPRQANSKVFSAFFD